MTTHEVEDLYDKLNQRLNIPEEEVNEIAIALLNAPEDRSITLELRVESVLAQENLSREVFEKVLFEHEVKMFVEPDTIILHLLLSNPRLEEDDMPLIESWADQLGHLDWFKKVVDTTAQMAKHHMGVKYNGQSLFDVEKLRHTFVVLTAYQKQKTEA